MRKPGVRREAVKPRGGPRAAGGRAPRQSGREDELQRRLDEAEAGFKALAETLPITTYVTAMDVQGSFTYVSPQVESLLGFQPEEWLDNPHLWLERLHPADRQRVLTALGRSHRGGKRYREEYRLLDRSGRPRWIRDESQVVSGAAGRPLSIQGTWTDITRGKELESELLGKNRELAASKAEVEQFVSVASHEFSAPLRRISNLGELLARRCEGCLDAESERLLARMMASAAHMRELVQGLVKYAEQGRTREAFSRVDAAAALEQALGDLEELVAASGAAVTHGPLPAVWAEPALLRQVFFNLLDNALKFRGEEKPRIHVSAEKWAQVWRVSVRDNGVGLHPHQDQRIFSIFDQLHPRKEDAGVGLGLAVCRKIVERFGGRIWVESELGEGAVFHFTLPDAEREPRA